MPDLNEVNDEMTLELDDEAPKEWGELSLKISDAKLREWSVSMPYPPDGVSVDEAVLALREALRIIVRGRLVDDPPAGQGGADAARS